MWEEKCAFCTYISKTQEQWLAHMAGHDNERQECANIVLACDSGRGNEKIIADSIRRRAP